MTKDYYRILGVLDDAEDIVIRAAYKVLAQKYHPDKWKGDKEEATRRMSEINEAYGVLSDAEKRKQYDSIRDKAEYQEDANEEDNSDFNKSLEDDWKSATEYFPDLIALAYNLAKFSYKLEYTFKVIIIEQKAFNDRTKIAQNIEYTFLSKFFGTNQEIIKFAKNLIINNQKDAAKELNKAVSLLGSDVYPDIIINKIIKKFNLEKYQFATRFKNLTTSEGDFISLDESILLMEKAGVQNIGFTKDFVPKYYSFKWQEQYYSLDIDEFKFFLKNTIIPFLNN